MSVDESFLTSLASFARPDEGFTEAFVEAELGGAATVAILSRPVEPASPLGWVLCPAFGPEQMHLLRLESLVARALAGSGFPVLRFHGQGYGDSEGSDEPTLSSHLADARDAAALLRHLTGVRRVGAAGARLGGTVALLLGVEQDLPAVAMWQPAVHGRAHVRHVEWQERAASMLISRAKQPAEMSRVSGHGDIAEVDLVAGARGFRGHSLVVAVTRDGGLPDPTISLVDELRSAGDCTAEVIQDRFAGQFGGPYHRYIGAARWKRDIRLALDRAIAGATVAWARSLPTDAAGLR